ncbi:hypothetical protein SynSYN20_02924 [Synechococcus sp. SYN20]|nr:hypothetical protein SynSYN20_02924 [Synechococcus sp. SYN20]
MHLRATTQPYSHTEIREVAHFITRTAENQNATSINTVSTSFSTPGIQSIDGR